MCEWPGARITWPPGSCPQISVPDTQGSSRTSDMVARFVGLISNMRPITCLLSLGRSRKRRQGPLITSGFFSGSVAPLPFVSGVSVLGIVAFEPGIASRSGVSKSVVDLDGAGVSEPLRISVPGVGGAAKSLYELSVMRGSFQGNLRSDIQQKMMASDQISAGWGSYFLSS